MSLSDLSDVLKPVAEARGLPNAHYTSEEVFQAERKPLWFDTWAGICTASDVPEPGDARPVDFLGVPLFVLRGKDGVVRVFQNICRHRGMILVTEPRKIEGAIRCPYHSWCYSHEGRLVATPHVGGPGHNTHPEMKREEMGLMEVRAHVWMDVVFINLSGDAPAFEEQHAKLIDRWGEFDVPLYHGGADSTFTLICRTNWKLAVENYCESYHLPWVHPGLNSYSRLEDHYHIMEPEFSGQGTEVYRQIEDEDGMRFPDFPGLSEKWDTAGEYVTVTPNVLLGVQRDHVFAILLEPKGAGVTEEHIHLYYAVPEAPEGLRRKNAAQWRVVFEEDIGVVEGMQKARGAWGYDGGRFSPAMDGPTHHFHRWVAERLMRSEGALAAE
ncbi:aromatic ring-hydroxylating oxygenase subunit alpha [Ovoidimarina sediminis]|uniref:aromatic ring-hydroxylating oxygenase subunit alpha n=1 Tax=Ovoidimarina sediminis TaxID=3079856 RepID=UPI00290D6569|nr:aromatic ring-hydroxylating dioxygenase subunit alpha [Rhodophyticola sp. MJ-SS7]MDU8942278.1 aromatic ring-hydroxylating dioxygenase subunit alpha [Rhodophyticola sp. MJ-SS7]